MNSGGTNKQTIKRIAFSAIVLAWGFFSFMETTQAATGINKQINFQGKVVNTDGTNVANASYNFLFCIYTTASPATPCTAGADNDAVWRESKSLTVTDGVFQSNLGDTTAFASLIDFNTDNIYLGINFNSNGQMTPLVRFTTAPYALNAGKVGGLTVTDTTGTLTIGAGKTISFADSFATSGAFATTLTSTAITNVTLPTTGTLATLSGSEILNNKTIGSAGLIFSGATTDITTTSGEDLTLVAGGVGVISLNDSVTVSGALGANGGITFDASTDTIGSHTAGGTILMNTNILQDIGNTGTDFIATTGALTLAGVLTANGGMTLAGGQSLSAGALSFVDLGLIVHNTTANQGLRLPNAASATPSNPTSGEGYLAWDTAGNQLIAYNGAAWTTVGGGSQTPWTSDISAGGFDLGSLSNLGFQETTGAPTGTDVGFYRDNAGDLTGNVLTGKTLNVAVNGADEYNFSSTGLVMNTNILQDIGNTGTDFIATTGALTLAGVLTANGGVTVAGGQNLVMSSGVGVATQTHAPASDATADAHNITLSAGGTGSTGVLRGFVVSQADTATTGVYDTLAYLENLKTPETTTNGLFINNNAAAGTLTNAIHISNTAGTLTSAIVIDGTAPASFILDTASIDISGAGAISGATGVSSTTGTFSSTLAANGGITFDASTDTIGSHTAGGTILMNTNILQDIGNTGTDFIATTGALTLAGILTANGGISLGTQALTGSTGNIDYTNFDMLGASGNTDIGGTITAGSGNIALTDATGNILHDALVACADTQILKYATAGAWGCATDATSAGAGIATIQENDVDAVTSATTIDFLGTDFVVGAVGAEGNISIDYANSSIARKSQAETVTGGWTFNTVATAFTTAINANGGISLGTQALTGTTGIINYTGFDVDASGNLDALGTLTAGSGNVQVTDAAGKVQHDAIVDCADEQILKWQSGGAGWGCEADATGSGGGLSVRSFIDSTADAVVDNLTTSYWDTAAENNNVFPNITLSTTSKSIYGVVTVETQATGTADVEVTTRVEVATTSGASCNTGTAVGGQPGTFASNTNARKTSTTTFIYSPASTAILYFNICSDTDTVGTTANVTRLRVSLFEVDNSNADLAEIYPTNDATLSPGEVVSIDPSMSYGIRRSGKYDTSAIGIVTTEPAIVIGGQGPEGVTGVAVALAGRVPVKVSTENGAIVAGDTLTPSSIPGVAMKATRPGPILGKAMGAYQGEDVGVVMTFVQNGWGGPDASLASSNILELTVDTLTARKIKAESIEGLEIFTNQISSLAEKYAGLAVLADVTATTPVTEEASQASSGASLPMNVLFKSASIDTLTVQLDTHLIGKLIADGGLVVVDKAEFRGETIFRKIASFFGNVIFKGEVAFEKTPTFNSDTAGFAVIAKGQKSVEIAFDEVYAKQPIVSATLSMDETIATKEVTDEDIKDMERDFMDAYFESDIKSVVIKKSIKGFTIVLNKKAPSDLSFSWMALAVNGSKTSYSQDTKESRSEAKTEEGTVKTPIVSETVHEEEVVVVTPSAESVTEATSVSEETEVMVDDTSTDVVSAEISTDEASNQTL